MASSVQLNNSNFSPAVVPNIWQVDGCKIELLNGNEVAITISDKRHVYNISSVQFVDDSRWTNLKKYCGFTGKCLQEILNGVKEIGFNGEGNRDHLTVILFKQPYDWDEIGPKD